HLKLKTFPSLFLFCLLTEMCSLKTCAQFCQNPCYCPWTVPYCPPGVPLVMDGCGCCRICARRLGQPCDEVNVCDNSQGLICDFRTSYPLERGVCVFDSNSNCEMNGVIYKEGETFQPSCKFQCRCSDGGITCIPLCSEDVQLSSSECPFPRRVEIPGKCCAEWICDKQDSGVLNDAMAAYRLEVGYGSDLLISSSYGNCEEQSTEWNACSKTCGMGVSTRVSNKNQYCRLETQSRLCIVRPCHPVLGITVMRRRGCSWTVRASKLIHFEYKSCISIKTYQPTFCGSCNDGRCCTPYNTETIAVEFKCQRGRIIKKQMMFINSCSCHYSC
uniref:Cellular communication network factor 5 n=1 Tax=Latimeria chalumnae TaxID=7897 RepID=H3A4I7_LATCH